MEGIDKDMNQRSDFVTLEEERKLLLMKTQVKNLRLGVESAASTAPRSSSFQRHKLVHVSFH